MKRKTCDSNILNLAELINIYGDDSAETITTALLGFLESASIYVHALQHAHLENDLPAVSAAAHSLKGICGLTGVTYLASLSGQLELAAATHQHANVAALMLEFAAHWPVVQNQIQCVLEQYGG